MESEEKSYKSARFFVISVGKEDAGNISMSQEEGPPSTWTSTSPGNRRLTKAFSNSPGPIYLFFTVFQTGTYCGVAKMMSTVCEPRKIWGNGRTWGSRFRVSWLEKGKNISIPTSIQYHNDAIEIEEHDLGVKIIREFLGASAPKPKGNTQEKITLFFPKRKMPETDQNSKKPKPF